jgi:hypothetical protein
MTQAVALALRRNKESHARDQPVFMAGSRIATFVPAPTTTIHREKAMNSRLSRAAMWAAAILIIALTQAALT